MRSVVVLPAPLGPSRPVISPSRATNETPATARTAPNDLCRFSTSNISLRLPAVGGDERRARAERVHAARVELLGLELGEELGGELRDAAAIHDDVALAFADQVPRVLELLHRL